MTMETQPFAITLNVGSSLANETGSWRTERPVYVNLLPPCNVACPAGENIQQWLYHAEEGDYEGAWREIMVNNPLPATMGRVCYHPCQTACNRVQVDEAVGINAIERFLGDKAIAEGWTVPVTAPDSGKSVLIVGAGPSGLSAAYHLRMAGHRVHIKEAGPMAGGMMRFGIPSYRLPRHILEAEIKRIKDMGVTFFLFSLALVFAFGIAPYTLADGTISADIPAFLPWLVVILVSLFVFAKQSGTVNWVLVSEIFPARIRGIAQGFAVGCGWLMNAVVTWVFPVMIAHLGAAKTYAVFGAINVLSLLFYIYIVPETKGVSLEEFEQEFALEHGY